MMTIRSDQMAHMDDAMQRRYHEQLRKLLREESPELTARFDDPTLLDRIAVAVPKARAYGIRTDEGIVAYVGLSLAAGPSFHDDPTIHHFLESKNDDPDLKIRWMYNDVVRTLQRITGQNRRA